MKALERRRMAETETRWTIRHDRAILALLQEDTEREACKRARISRATMTRYKRWPVFQQRLDKEQRELFDATKRRLLLASQEAVATLSLAQSDSRCPWTAKIAAARTVIAATVRMRESEIADQLDRLENGEDDELPIGEVLQ
jgi:hypothetical protein